MELRKNINDFMHIDDDMDIVSDIFIPALPYLGALGSILGTFMMTSRIQDHRIKGMEIALYGAMCWIAFSVLSSIWALLATNLFFIGVYLYGLWNNIGSNVIELESCTCGTDHK